MNKNFALSESLRLLTIHKNVYRNALAACKRLPEAIYIEGWIRYHMYPSMLIEHAWLESKGEIVDPIYPEKVNGADLYISCWKYDLEDIYEITDGKQEFKLVFPITFCYVNQREYLEKENELWRKDEQRTNTDSIV